MNDGKTQLSFTLPVPNGDEGIEAAKQLMKKIMKKKNILKKLIKNLMIL